MSQQTERIKTTKRTLWNKKIQQSEFKTSLAGLNRRMEAREDKIRACDIHHQKRSHLNNWESGDWRGSQGWSLRAYRLVIQSLSCVQLFCDPNGL